MSELGSPATPAPQEPPAAEPHPVFAAVDQAHSAAKAQYGKVKDASNGLDKVRKELDQLASMGDAVTQEDVIKAAGMLVGHGMDTMPLAGLLASMPADGEPLAAWVQEHAQTVTQREQQLAPVKSAAQHALGNAALHKLALDHVGKLLAQGQAGTGAANALTPQAGGPNG